jgi:hypothetical protein
MGGKYGDAKIWRAGIEKKRRTEKKKNLETPKFW